MGNHLEINSLSLQSTEISNPLELVVPQVVTTKMLSNAEKSLKIIEGVSPDTKNRISLHVSGLMKLYKILFNSQKVLFVIWLGG